jgi:sRNA-binding carbon storage regulator CsrA
MSLILTRRPGEAIIITGGGLPPRRLYVVAIERNVVRLALDAPPEIMFTREELLPAEDRRQWWTPTANNLGWAKVAALMATTYVLERLLFLRVL